MSIKLETNMLTHVLSEIKNAYNSKHFTLGGCFCGQGVFDVNEDIVLVIDVRCPKSLKCDNELYSCEVKLFEKADMTDLLSQQYNRYFESDSDEAWQDEFEEFEYHNLEEYLMRESELKLSSFDERLIKEEMFKLYDVYSVNQIEHEKSIKYKGEANLVKAYNKNETQDKLIIECGHEFVILKSNWYTWDMSKKMLGKDEEDANHPLVMSITTDEDCLYGEVDDGAYAGMTVSNMIALRDYLDEKIKFLTK